MAHDGAEQAARAAPQIEASEDEENVAEVVQGSGGDGGCLFQQVTSLFES